MTAPFSRFLLIFVIGLAGCATPEIKAPLPQAAGAFELLGRVAVTSPEQKFSGSLRWTHAPDQDELWFLTPLGNSVAHLLKDPAGVTLKTQEQTYQAADVESLTRQVLGWGLPLTGLESWVRGVSVPGVPAAIERDGEGRLARVEQDGWEISYLRYSEERGLPEKLRVSGRGLEITLIIDDWLLPISPPTPLHQGWIGEPIVPFSLGEKG